MVDPDLFELARSSLRLSFTLTLPIVIATAAGGVAAGALQSMTRVHDASVGHLGRVLGACAAVALFAATIGHALIAFFGRALEIGVAG
ncbi:MAG: flagellar biosynthetic protein FliQ [Polyangiales bacterium]